MKSLFEEVLDVTIKISKKTVRFEKTGKVMEKDVEIEKNVVT